MRNFKPQLVFLTGLACLVTTVGIGTFHAFTRGGNDFSVFYQAWHLVSQGQGHDIYRLSPDRFLYSPGFAWIFSPLGLLPRNVALGFWCLLKIFLLFFSIKKLTDALNQDPQPGQNLVQNQNFWLTYGISFWSASLVIRPLLIDFEYGQVNLLILASCLWGLFGHFEKESPYGLDVIRWIVLTGIAIAKLITLPLLLVPFIATRYWQSQAKIAPQKLNAEKLGIFLGIFISFAFPLINQGFDGTWFLLTQWAEALFSRGLPLESHNQSFVALLYHYLSGQPTHVIAEGSGSILFGGSYLSSREIGFYSLFWSFCAMGFMLGWILCASSHPRLKWVAVLIGLLIVPSHLIWKPYFVMSLPLAVLLFHQNLKTPHLRPGLAQWQKFLYQVTPRAILLIFFLGLNFTGFDFVGHSLAAYLEAASLFLLIHLFMIGIIAFDAMERFYRGKLLR